MAGNATASRPARSDAVEPPLVPDGLPPGPQLPAPIQTARLIARPVRFLEDCRRRYGDTFTARVLRAGPMVFVSDPASLKRLFGGRSREHDRPGAKRRPGAAPRASARCSCSRARSTCAGAS